MKFHQTLLGLVVSLPVLCLSPAYGLTIDQDGCGKFEQGESQCFSHTDKWRKWSGFGEGNDILMATYKNQCGHRVYVHTEGMLKEKPFSFSSGFVGYSFGVPNGKSATKEFYDSTGHVIYTVVISEKGRKDWVCIDRYGAKTKDLHKEAIKQWGTPSGWNQSPSSP